MSAFGPEDKVVPNKADGSVVVASFCSLPVGQQKSVRLKNSEEKVAFLVVRQATFGEYAAEHPGMSEEKLQFIKQSYGFFYLVQPD